jgi:hypothetical protein
VLKQPRPQLAVTAMSADADNSAAAVAFFARFE